MTSNALLCLSHQNSGLIFFSTLTRDLKDENIVIDENYDAKIIDFGSASRIPSDPRDYFSQFLGTLDFAAPENVLKERYQGPQSEIWSLGVVLYIVAFQKLPFGRPEETYQCRLTIPQHSDASKFKHPSRLRAHRPWLLTWWAALGLAHLLERMLEPDMHRRITINEVMNHPWLDGPTNAPGKSNHIRTSPMVPQRFPHNPRRGGNAGRGRGKVQARRPGGRKHHQKRGNGPVHQRS